MLHRSKLCIIKFIQSYWEVICNVVTFPLLFLSSELVTVLNYNTINIYSHYTYIIL